MDIPEYLKQSNREIREKFKYIQNQEDERIRDSLFYPDTTLWSFNTSLKKRNCYRNRYVNILPFERNRVKLSVEHNTNDYINASDIIVNVKNQSINEGHYIATQGPTFDTWQQFWQMCYSSCPEKNIVIVMVTPLEEGHKEKCFKYWPDSVEKEYVIDQIQDTGDNSISQFKEQLVVEHITTENHRKQYGYVMNKMKLYGNSKDDYKNVYHFYFDHWRDMSKPEEIIPIMKLSHHSHNLNSPGNPIIVHCSAGVGRTGTFITLDHLIHDTQDFKVDNATGQLHYVKGYQHDLIEQIVMQLRNQRLKMVQMDTQYAFLYHAARYLYEVYNK